MARRRLIGGPGGASLSHYALSLVDAVRWRGGSFRIRGGDARTFASASRRFWRNTRLDVRRMPRTIRAHFPVASSAIVGARADGYDARTATGATRLDDAHRSRRIFAPSAHARIRRRPGSVRAPASLPHVDAADTFHRARAASARVVIVIVASVASASRPHEHLARAHIRLF